MAIPVPTRTAARALPRASIAIAAAGCGLAVLGTVLLGGDNLDDGGGGGGSQLPGIALSAAVVVGGFVLLRAYRTGPLATAGSVAAAFGVPPLLFFLTFDSHDLPPYSTTAILVVSTVAWGLGYVAGPSRGRPLFLGAACIGGWLSMLQLTEDVLSFPFDAMASFATFESVGVDEPDATVVGLLSLAFGGGYLLLARRGDRTGRHGTATPLVAAGLVALPVGVIALTDDLEATGAGLLAVALGVLVALHGGTVARRGTTWLGAAGVAAGVVAIVDDNVSDPTPAGLCLLGLGAATVAGAELLRRATGEPDELTAPEPTTF